MKIKKVKTFYFNKNLIGTEKDFDQYVYQLIDSSPNDETIVAVVETEKYYFYIVLAGEQRVFNLKTGKQIINSPEEFLDLYRKEEIVIGDSCWLEIDIAKKENIKRKENTGIVISSIKEAIEYIENFKENEVEELFEPEASGF